MFFFLRRINTIHLISHRYRKNSRRKKRHMKRRDFNGTVLIPWTIQDNQSIDPQIHRSIDPSRWMFCFRHRHRSLSTNINIDIDGCDPSIHPSDRPDSPSRKKANKQANRTLRSSKLSHFKGYKFDFCTVYNMWFSLLTDIPCEISVINIVLGNLHNMRVTDMHCCTQRNKTFAWFSISGMLQSATRTISPKSAKKSFPSINQFLAKTDNVCANVVSGTKHGMHVWLV